MLMCIKITQSEEGESQTLTTKKVKTLRGVIQRFMQERDDIAPEFE